MPLLPLTALAMLAFAANSVLNRMAVAQGWSDPAGFALVRLGAGALALAVLVLLRAGPRWPGWRGRSGGVAGLIVYLFSFSAAYAVLDSGTGALLLFGAVQVTMFAGALAAGEGVPRRRWLGAGLALGGLALLVAPGAGGAPPLGAAALMVLAGIGWGAYSLAGRGAADPLAATAANFVLAAPVAVGLLAVVPALQPDGWPAPGGLALAALSGAVTSGGGYALWYAVLPRLGAARAGLVQLTVPVIAAAGGALLLAEPPGWRFAAAAAVVAAGVWVGVAQPRGDRGGTGFSVTK
jgi:drug/metabolite transporter (DMT)-like permease